MKLQLLAVTCGFIFATGCDTTGNTTASTGTTSADYSTANAAIDPSSIPGGIQTEFLTRYPTATAAEWSRYNDLASPIEWDLTGWPALTDQDYVVRYNIDNAPYYSWYDANGNWIGSTSLMTDYASLPVPVNNMITSQYNGYLINSAYATTWQDKKAYQIELKNDLGKVKVLVDENGNIIKSKVKNDK